MPLTPESQEFVKLVEKLVPIPVEEMTFEQYREGQRARTVPSKIEIFQTEDLDVPTRAGSVPVRIYHPNDDTSNPIVMFMHGGGWSGGDLDYHDDWLRRIANDASVVIVSVDYRLVPENPYPAGLDDCMDVWAWLQTAPSEVRGDHRRLGVAGDSSGGNFAFAVALRARDEGGKVPDAIVSVYGAPDIRITNPELGTAVLTPEGGRHFMNAYTDGGALLSDPYCNPASADSLAGLGPSLLIVAEYDPMRDANEDFARRLADEGVLVSFTRYGGVVHGFARMFDIIPEAQLALDELTGFLKVNLTARAG